MELYKIGAKDESKLNSKKFKITKPNKQNNYNRGF